MRWWWHRLRGHQLHRGWRTIDMGSVGPAKIIEAGRTERYIACDCGAVWAAL